MRKLKFDPLEVRPSFRSTFCRELMLPSGKRSGILYFPIGTDEIRQLTSDLTDDDYAKTIARDVCKTESEYLLWTALRLKYGITYLSHKNGYRPVNDNRYEPPVAEDIFDKINFEIEAMGQNVFSELSPKIIDLRLELEEEKKLLERLTKPETML